MFNGAKEGVRGGGEGSERGGGGDVHNSVHPAFACKVLEGMQLGLAMRK